MSNNVLKSRVRHMDVSNLPGKSKLWTGKWPNLKNMLVRSTNCETVTGNCGSVDEVNCFTLFCTRC